MGKKSAIVILLTALIVFQPYSPVVSAQAPPPTPEQLDQLLAPIALYPDSLLAQITTASTNPQEILDVVNWLQQNPGLTGNALTDAAQMQGFDPAFIALVNFPQVLQDMAHHIDDYAAIGDAVSADQGAVTASIQRLRAQAYAAGTLQSNSQQQVQVQQSAGQTIYVIQPANPQVVYVPVYDPTVVYARPASSVLATSLITFGVGIGIGALIASNQPWGWGGWGWNWGSRRVYYNHVAWGGWGRPYRPPNVWYRPRPVVYANRPGYRGNWSYRPSNYRPPGRPINRPSYTRPPYGPNNRPGYNRSVNRSNTTRSVPPNRVTPNQPRRQPSSTTRPNQPARQPSSTARPNQPPRQQSSNTRPNQSSRQPSSSSRPQRSGGQQHAPH